MSAFRSARSRTLQNTSRYRSGEHRPNPCSPTEVALGLAGLVLLIFPLVVFACFGFGEAECEADWDHHGF